MPIDEPVVYDDGRVPYPAFDIGYEGETFAGNRAVGVNASSGVVAGIAARSGSVAAVVGSVGVVAGVVAFTGAVAGASGATGAVAGAVGYTGSVTGVSGTVGAGAGSVGFTGLIGGSCGGCSDRITLVYRISQRDRDRGGNCHRV
jgi:hypothetical protein